MPALGGRLDSSVLASCFPFVNNGFFLCWLFNCFPRFDLIVLLT
jgi:hypothetical protein